jgi:hypothetical protein
MLHFGMGWRSGRDPGAGAGRRRSLHLDAGRRLRRSRNPNMVRCSIAETRKEELGFASRAILVRRAPGEGRTTLGFGEDRGATLGFGEDRGTTPGFGEDRGAA